METSPGDDACPFVMNSPNPACRLDPASSDTAALALIDVNCRPETCSHDNLRGKYLPQAPPIDRRYGIG
ncbi:hypothetical protein BIV08_23620 [Pseudomonas sp. AF76]|uniref:hypothetical protein n=1 Tax=Pseudomonas sp. 22447 TaxID=3453919 RepID=UPI00093142EF|nr:hypothetical protein BIV08_23620 [Pseudomonas sp. AF76]ROO36796.1 hypothetical protein BIV09_16800 [Pseudomonas sp. 7SR1]